MFEISLMYEMWNIGNLCLNLVIFIFLDIEYYENKYK